MAVLNGPKAVPQSRTSLDKKTIQTVANGSLPHGQLGAAPLQLYTKIRYSEPNSPPWTVQTPMILSDLQHIHPKNSGLTLNVHRNHRMYMYIHVYLEQTACRRSQPPERTFMVRNNDQNQALDLLVYQTIYTIQSVPQHKLNHLHTRPETACFFVQVILSPAVQQQHRTA